MAVRALTLPIDPALEELAIEAVGEALTRAGVLPDEQPDFLSSRYASWRQGISRDPVFSDAVCRGLKAGDTRWGTVLSDNYFRLHEDILRRKHLCTFDQATALLSHIRLVLLVVSDDMMSAAQAAKILRVRDRRVTVGWRALQNVLSTLGVRIDIDQARVQRLLIEERQQEEYVFADAGFFDAATSVAELGLDLGFGEGLDELLLRVFPAEPTGDRHGPYLQILHAVLITAEYFDHALKYVYEFKPRGFLGNMVHDAYPNHLRSSTVAILNNAKSVDALDEGWARSKEEHLGGATALYEIVDRLEDMPFLARRELARRLRQWLFRVIRLMQPLSVSIPSLPSESDVEAILAAVSAGPTGTYGILEQRVTDAIASHMYPAMNDWRPHGIGDSVNATNASRKKVGDCEFQRPKEIVAFEAHAGRLSEMYVDGHIAGLRRVVGMRKDEWGRIAAPHEWHITVRFLAHGDLPRDRVENIDGYAIKCTFEEYSSFIAAGPPLSELRTTFETQVIPRLNEAGTPESVRSKYLSLIGK